VVSWAPRPTPASRRSRRLSMPPSRFKLSPCNYGFLLSFDVCLTGSFLIEALGSPKIICCTGKQRGVRGFDDSLTANSFSFRWVRRSLVALFGSCSNKKKTPIFLSRTPMAPMYQLSADTHECISYLFNLLMVLVVPSELGIHVCFVSCSL
jgi:hypothetical protein